MPGLPNLFVVGAAKSGTTALYHYLRAHPQIYVPSTIKEPNYMAFFAGLPVLNGPGDRVHGAARSITRLEDYEKLYADWNHAKVAADVSPAYLHRPHAAAKIAELCPRAKIVMLLRNPIEATFSMFSMMHRDRRENCDSFAEAFHRTHERLAAGWEWAWDYQSCFYYSDQVARFLDLFPREQLFIRRYEELKCTPEKFYRDLMEFIGVDNLNSADANRWVNVGAQRSDILRRTRTGKVLLELARAARKVLPQTVLKRLKLDVLHQPAFKLAPKDRRMLADHFRDDIRRLSTLLKWNLDDWILLDEPSPKPRTLSRNTCQV